MKRIIHKIIEAFGNTCYYPGCLTRAALPEIEDNYVQLLHKLDIDFITIPDEMICCGAPVLNAGYQAEFNEHKIRLASYFNKSSVSKIITSCPTCYSMLKKNYTYKVEHFTEVVHRKMKFLRAFAKGEKIAYHDPCHLGRYERVYDEPRDILRAMGFSVVEMRDNREKSLCCGAGAGLRNIRPKMSAEIAKIRNRQALDTGADMVVTCCPMCYSHLKENAPPGLQVFELSELLLKSFSKG